MTEYPALIEPDDVVQPGGGGAVKGVSFDFYRHRALRCWLGRELDDFCRSRPPGSKLGCDRTDAVAVNTPSRDERVQLGIFPVALRKSPGFPGLGPVPQQLNDAALIQPLF